MTIETSKRWFPETMAPKISIVVPVWNVEKFLPDCLESILAQTEKDLQIICVDDGSPDRSPQMLDDYAAKDSRITVIHKKNGGLSSARNAAYPLIRGKYTLFVDSDDYIDPTLCEKTYALAEKEQADMTFFFSNNTSGKPLPSVLKKLLKDNSHENIVFTILDDHIASAAWTKLWKTDFLLSNGICFPEGIYYEDQVAQWKAMIYKPKTAFSSEHLYCYRENPNSITKGKSIKNIMDIISCFDLIKSELLEKRLYSGEWKNIYLKQKLRLIHARYVTTERKSLALAKEMVKATYGPDERSFIENDREINWYVKDFYRSLDDVNAGNVLAKIRNGINPLLVGLGRSIAKCVRSCPRDQQ